MNKPRPPYRKDYTKELEELLFDTQRQLGELVDKKRLEQAQEIALSDGIGSEYERPYDLIEKFIDNYSPDQVLLFFLGPRIVEKAARKYLGNRAVSLLTEQKQGGEKQDEEITKRLIDSLLFVLIRKAWEVETLPDEIPSEEIIRLRESWRSQAAIPYQPHIPGIRDVLSAVLHLSSQIEKVPAAVMQAIKSLMDDLRASQVSALNSFSSEIKHTRLC